MNYSEDKPMVSVVMIAYNQAGVISEAIRGVVNQKAPFKIELVIVDDASSDATYDVALDWQRRFPDIIKVFRNPRNIGIQANYVEAFRHCTGKYLAMCDADDYWFCKRKLAIQVGYMERHPDCAITFHRVVNLYVDNGEMSLSNGGQAPDATAADLSRANFITNLSVVYRRELVDTLALPSWVLDINLIDYAMHLFYASKGYIHYFKRPMAVYRVSRSGGTWSMAQNYRRLEMALKVREHLMSHFADREDITSGLKEASTDILLSMINAAGDDMALHKAAIQRLLSMNVFKSEKEIEAAAAKRNVIRKSTLKKVASSARAAISRLIPRPHP